MSTITKERVAGIANGEKCYTHDDVLELARIALASLEAEAVAINDDMAYAFHHALSDSSLGADEVEEIKTGLRAAFANVTTPPAPVSVPDGVSGPLAYAYKELTTTFMRNHIDVFERYGIYPDGSAGIHAMRIALDGMERRAAMLQSFGNSEQLNSPVIQDGWVACSERMPERGVDVLVCKMNPYGAYDEIETAQWHGGMKGDQTVFITSSDAMEPEFWQPLPAAPQQEA